VVATTKEACGTPAMAVATVVVPATVAMAAEHRATVEVMTTVVIRDRVAMDRAIHTASSMAVRNITVSLIDP